MWVFDLSEKIINAASIASKNNYTVGKVSRIIRLLSSLMLISVEVCKKINLNIDYRVISYNLWNIEIRNFFNDRIIYIIVFWVIYEAVVYNILFYLVCYIDKSEKTVSIPVLFTINDLVDLGSSVFFLGDSVNKWIEGKNGIENSDQQVIFIAGLCLIFSFVAWLYRKNSNNWSFEEEFTNYYDINGNRIPKGANVIYYGKGYSVYWSGDVLGIHNKEQEYEWRIMSRDNDRQSIALEVAARNREGNLMLESWKGERV